MASKKSSLQISKNFAAKLLLKFNFEVIGFFVRKKCFVLIYAGERIELEGGFFRGHGVSSLCQLRGQESHNLEGKKYKNIEL
jgi:hypothetical protein